MMKKWIIGAVALVALLVGGSSAYAQTPGQITITSLAGTEYVNVMPATGPQFEQITTANLAAYVIGGGAINPLNVGSNGVGGTLNIFPPTSSNGKFEIVGVNAGGAFNTIISPGTIGQTSTITIPDPGSSTANFLLSKGTQTASGAMTWSAAAVFSSTVATGALTVTGAETVSTTLGVTGVESLGSSGSVGELDVFPPTAANGVLKLVGVNAGGAFNTIISPGTIGQTSTITIPDPGQSTANFVLDHGTQTVATTATFSGADTFSSTLTVTGALTTTAATVPNGGVGVARNVDAAAASIQLTSSAREIATCGAPATLTTSGTDTTDAANTDTYVAEIDVPWNVSTTGAAVFNGTTPATNMTVYLADSGGNQVAHTASTAQSGATAYQRVAWVGGPIAITGPGTYYLAIQGSGTTLDLRMWAVGNCGTVLLTGDTYGTFPANLVGAGPATFVTLQGPLMSLY